jgi:SAM-dependent methyltransferase
MADQDSDPTALFDRRAWRAHRDRAGRNGPVEFLHAEIADGLMERLADIDRRFPRVLDWGAHGGATARALAQRPGTELVVAAEPAMALLRRCPGRRVAVDVELVPFRDGCFDLAVSGLALHWAGDLPGALIQLRRALRPDGLFLAAMLGGATLAELRTALLEAELDEEGGASPRVSPFAELSDAAGLLQRTGFAMPVADSDTFTVTYPDVLALMRELRGIGETNALAARRRTPLRRATLARASALYTERFGLGDGRIHATFEILYLTGWAPAADQPKPLRPGSATRSLADALGTREIPAGGHARPPKQPE